MTARQTRKFVKCINSIDECINETALLDQDGWQCVLDDIDLKIEECQERIKEMRKARKAVVRCKDNCKTFPWKEAEEAAFLKKPLVING